MVIDNTDAAQTNQDQGLSERSSMLICLVQIKPSAVKPVAAAQIITAQLL